MTEKNKYNFEVVICMSQEYIFEYPGTMENFMAELQGIAPDCYPENKFYYFNNYIIDLTDDKIKFGVERAGHSGGHWFIPEITECDKKVVFKGTIEYIGPEKKDVTDERSVFKKCIETIFSCIAFVVLFPIILITLIYELFNRIKYKRKYPDAGKIKTTEDKLINLMEYHLRCIRK